MSKVLAISVAVVIVGLLITLYVVIQENRRLNQNNMALQVKIDQLTTSTPANSSRTWLYIPLTFDPEQEDRLCYAHYDFRQLNAAGGQLHTYYDLTEDSWTGLALEAYNPERGTCWRIPEDLKKELPNWRNLPWNLHVEWSEDLGPFPPDATVGIPIPTPESK